MPRRSSEALLVLGILFTSGLTTALPAVSAQSTVMVSIPNGASAGASAAPGYSPDSVNVVIGVNNTVTWTNNDTAHHTVTATNGAFNSGDIAPGATYTFTFTTPGTYNYTCNYHDWMKGSVVVLAASTSSTSTTPEFPSVPIALLLFAVIAAALVTVPLLRPSVRAEARVAAGSEHSS